MRRTLACLCDSSSLIFAHNFVNQNDMCIINPDCNKDGKNSLSDFAGQLGSFFGNLLKGAEDGIEKFSKQLDEALDAFDKGIDGKAQLAEAVSKANIDYSEMENLDSTTFFGICRGTILEEADAIAAYWNPATDGKANFIYLANVLNRELLPVEKNKYAVIKAKSVVDDVKEVFGDEKLVIID